MAISGPRGTRTQGGGLLRALRHDTAGNTLAIMAASLIPLAAFAGSAIDTARLYVVKVRLQQACDSGVLAGRKFMLDTSPSTPLDSASQAQTFFKDNFREGWFTTQNVNFVPTKTSDSQVQGTAAATVPMTIMKMFNMPAVTLRVACMARYDVADADIMFVLDTTGSMACPTSAGSGGCGASTSTYTHQPDGTTAYYTVEQSGSKLSGLRSAVLSFYDTLAANVDPSTKIRYGFVTYTSTVNAGYSLPSGSLVTDWDYQSRKLQGETNNGSATSVVINNVTSATCDSNAGRTPSAGFTASGTAVVKSVSWVATTGTTAPGKCTVTSQPKKPVWRYTTVNYPVTQFITGATVDDPSKLDGSTSKWQGCVEERATTPSSSFNQSSLPPDLDPDLPPTSPGTRWKPMWPDVIYYRGNNQAPVDDSGDQTNPYGDASYYPSWGSPTYLAAGYATCGKPVQRLMQMSRSDVSNYVNASDFKPQGGTYHDTGMIWGTRMISPTGIFASDTAAWPGRSSPNRYIVFMTDGDMAPNQYIYGMYGMEYYDKRVTNGSYSNLEDYHNARFLAECSAAKARNITVFVVGFGQTLTPQLTACASPGKAYYASDNAALTAAFREIANQVASLRLSQ